jgi:sporulation protein YhbH
MSIFRVHETSADRSAQDRKRHKEKISRAIKDGIHNIISEESIIGKSGKTKIRIPVKGIKEYKFVYGDNEQNKRTGTAPGADMSKGQVIGKGAPDKQKGQSDKAGNDEGAELYDVEITLDDLAEYLFDDLKLPDLEKKRMKTILSTKLKRKGHRSQGIRPRLDKKETLKKKIRRTMLIKREAEESGEEFEGTSLNERDLRYRHVENRPKESSSAVVFFLMDVSGSMSTDKKFLSRSFFFLLYQFLRYKYENIEIVFISHTTTAKEVDEKEFFTHAESGGTFISPALTKVREIIDDRYHPSNWNIYAFHCSDGDNWESDVPLSVKESMALKELCQMYCYCEVIPLDEQVRWGNKKDTITMENYKPILDKKFKAVRIESKEDVWPSFKKIFGGKLNNV